ncbi:MAG: Homoserine kinase [Chroococcopsis gigantea SAG 12.99]|jgi:homoserine kinase|nr:homoserine kinase [Chlorogloea purpurea SAG 13.99]MDV2999438.1 Homoserine kinase [Chroococcopsis gigantea SAG 12.99]
MSSITVVIPATTANIGPGFDCLGAALTIYNRFTFRVDGDKPLEISVLGNSTQKVSTASDNLIYRSFLRVYETIGQTPPPLSISIDPGVPLSRGLGSSATAIVGGLVAANHFAGYPLGIHALRDLAISIEGHPDNVVPALLGNCQLSVSNGAKWEICQVPWNDRIIPVVAIPDFELSTEEARAVLPNQISRQDAIFNVAHLGLLLRGLETGEAQWLRIALADRIHQPYRQSLIKGYKEVESAALAGGAYGMVISGAGPTLLALSHPNHAQGVAESMQSAWNDQGVTATVRITSLDTQGARILTCN